MSFPRRKVNTGLRPNKFKKYLEKRKRQPHLIFNTNPKNLKTYQDNEDTHLTSKSRVITPDWSIDLNRTVKGNGSFTIVPQSCQLRPIYSLHRGFDVHITNPLKNALIHPIISVCGTIIAIFPLTMFIIWSIPAGSVIGFAGGCPTASGFLRKAPD